MRPNIEYIIMYYILNISGPTGQPLKALRWFFEFKNEFQIHNFIQTQQLLLQHNKWAHEGENEGPATV